MYKPNLTVKEIESVCRFSNVTVVVNEAEDAITIHTSISNTTDKPLVHINSNIENEADSIVELQYLEDINVIKINQLKIPNRESILFDSIALEVINLILTKIVEAGYMYGINVDSESTLQNIYRLQHYNIIVPDNYLLQQYVRGAELECEHVSNSVVLVTLKYNNHVVCKGRLIIDAYASGRTYYEVGNVTNLSDIDIRNNFMQFMKICKDISDEYNRRSVRELYSKHNLSYINKSLWLVS